MEKLWNKYMGKFEPKEEEYKESEWNRIEDEVEVYMKKYYQ